MESFPLCTVLHPSSALQQNLQRKWLSQVLFKKSLRRCFYSLNFQWNLRENSKIRSAHSKSNKMDCMIRCNKAYPHQHFLKLGKFDLKSFQLGHCLEICLAIVLLHLHSIQSNKHFTVHMWEWTNIKYLPIAFTPWGGPSPTFQEMNQMNKSMKEEVLTKTITLNDLFLHSNFSPQATKPANTAFK